MLLYGFPERRVSGRLWDGHHRQPGKTGLFHQPCAAHPRSNRYSAIDFDCRCNQLGVASLPRSGYPPRASIVPGARVGKQVRRRSPSRPSFPQTPRPQSAGQTPVQRGESSAPLPMLRFAPLSATYHPPEARSLRPGPDFSFHEPASVCRKREILIEYGKISYTVQDFFPALTGRYGGRAKRENGLLGEEVNRRY